MATPSADDIERGRRILRRQGMADAAVRLCGGRFALGRALDEYRVALGLTGPEIEAAVRRFKTYERPVGVAQRPGDDPTEPLEPPAEPEAPFRAVPGRRYTYETASAAVLDSLRRAGGSMEAPTGQGITVRIGDDTGFTPLNVSKFLSRMDEEGRVGRHLNGKRCFKVWVIEPE